MDTSNPFQKRVIELWLNPDINLSILVPISAV